jgi:hypothetical protein
MKYWVISESDKPVSIVFHDYMTSQYFCKSKSKSFKIVFNNLCKKNIKMLCREEDRLKARNTGPHSYSWMNSIIDSLCSCKWELSSKGELINDHLEVEKLVSNTFG